MPDLMSNFGDFPNGVAIRNMTAAFPHANSVFWVHSGTGSNANKGTFDRPYATVDAAIDACTASKGDVVMVKAGHAETISGSGTITLDKIGVKVVCLGEGANRPTFTFSATDSTILVSAASCTWMGGVMTPSVDNVVTAFQVQEADFSVDTTILDASSSVQFTRGLLTTTAGNRLRCRMKYDGNISGNGTVNAIRLVGTDVARIEIDFYGLASTAVVEFLTTACTDVRVTGYIYNSGTVDGSKNVVDTQGSSTYFVDVNDGAAGEKYIASNRQPSMAHATYNHLGRRVTKTGDVSTSIDALFTVTGKNLITLITAEISSVIATTTSLVLVTSTGTVNLCASTAIVTAAAGTLYMVTGDPDDALNGGQTPNADLAASKTGFRPHYIMNDDGINQSINGAGTGLILYELFYIPLEPGASITSAA